MAYLGVNIHDNIILSSQLTLINDKGSLVVGFATNADTSDMLSAFDEGSNLERAENGIILFCPSIKGFDGKAKTPTQVGQDLNNFKNTLVDILSVFMPVDKAKAALNTDVMFRGLGITKETQSTLATRLLDQNFIQAVYVNISNAFLTEAKPFMDSIPFRVKLRRTSKAKNFATIPYKGQVPEVWIEPMTVPKTASQIAWSKWELDNGMNSGAKVETDTTDTAQAAAVATMFAAPPVPGVVSEAPSADTAFGNIPVSPASAAFQQ